MNNLRAETEQNYENLSFHFGVIDKILRCSNSEQSVLGRKKCRNIFIKIVLLPQVRQVLKQVLVRQQSQFQIEVA